MGHILDLSFILVLRLWQRLMNLTYRLCNSCNSFNRGSFDYMYYRLRSCSGCATSCPNLDAPNELCNGIILRLSEKSVQLFFVAGLFLDIPISMDHVWRTNRQRKSELMQYKVRIKSMWQRTGLEPVTLHTTHVHKRHSQQLSHIETKQSEPNMTERITIAPSCSTSGEEILTRRRESLKRSVGKLVLFSRATLLSGVLRYPEEKLQISLYNT